jgi:non-heme chloroperoxidase
VPALVVQGTPDGIRPFSAGRRTAGRPDQGRPVVPVEGGPHTTAWTHPEEVNAALPEFLAS